MWFHNYFALENEQRQPLVVRRFFENDYLPLSDKAITLNFDFQKLTCSHVYFTC